jgi:hypothetical protein
MFWSRPRNKRGTAGLLALAVVGVLAGAAGAQSAPTLLAFDGHAWRALSEGEKLALLNGSLIGSASEHGMDQPVAQTPPTPETLEAARRDGRLRFPYAPAVYKARLEDFYFYEDRRAVPL